MRRSLFVVYRRPWWQRLGGIATIGAVAAAVPAFVVWSTEPVVIDAPPRAIAPPAPQGTPPASPPQQAVVQVQSEATATGAPSHAEREPSPPALSVQVAPGVHVTPIGVPDGGVPMPAGPHADDSEPEN